MYVCMYVCVCVCMYVCMYVCKYVCMYVCMYVCIYISMEVVTSRLCCRLVDVFWDVECYLAVYSFPHHGLSCHKTTLLKCIPLQLCAHLCHTVMSLVSPCDKSGTSLVYLYQVVVVWPGWLNDISWSNHQTILKYLSFIIVVWHFFGPSSGNPIDTMYWIHLYYYYHLQLNCKAVI